ncbi:MAG: DUF6516 family protein [Nitrospinota bacterium]
MSKRAKLIIKDRIELKDGAIVETRLWEVPTSKDKPHGYKYSLVYIIKGERLIGYDNAEGKGDHRHYGSSEETYRFKDVDSLVRDFFNDVEKIRGGEGNEGKKD